MEESQMFEARIGRVLVTLGLSLVISSAAFAQRQGQGRGFGAFGGGGGGIALLSRPEVQAELKLTDAQKTQVTDAMEKQRQGGRGNFQQLQNATPEERQKAMAERQAEQTKLVNSILNPDQQKRFKEISLQQQGLQALATPAVADELKLTADQKTQIQTVLQQRNETMRGLFQQGGNGGDFAAVRDKMTAMNKDTDTKLAALLTDDQKSQWKAMLGTPFALPPAQFGRRQNNNNN
jgi:Spy/CpxP family protein refolding chaperone